MGPGRIVPPSRAPSPAAGVRTPDRDTLANPPLSSIASRRLLVTGATGNVGGAVLGALAGTGHDVRAGVRNPARARERLGDTHPCVPVDFERGIVPDEPFDAVFLVRPPSLGDPTPLVDFVRRLQPSPKGGAPVVVFLSVQGVDRQPWLPHARIERAIEALGVPHVFLRSGYFMENLTTMLADDLRRGVVRLPAGDLALDWVAVRDVAAMATAALTCPVRSAHLRVGNVRLQRFADVVAELNRVCGTCLRYESASLPRYIADEWRAGRRAGWIGIMLMLHWLPRHVRRLAPSTPDPSDVIRVLGREPADIGSWARDNRDALRALLDGPDCP